MGTPPLTGGQDGPPPTAEGDPHIRGRVLTPPPLCLYQLCSTDTDAVPPVPHHQGAAPKEHPQDS